MVSRRRVSKIKRKRHKTKRAVIRSKINRRNSRSKRIKTKRVNKGRSRRSYNSKRGKCGKRSYNKQKKRFYNDRLVKGGGPWCQPPRKNRTNPDPSNLLRAQQTEADDARSALAAQAARIQALASQEAQAAQDARVARAAQAQALASQEAPADQEAQAAQASRTQAMASQAQASQALVTMTRDMNEADQKERPAAQMKDHLPRLRRSSKAALDKRLRSTDTQAYQASQQDVEKVFGDSDMVSILREQGLDPVDLGRLAQTGHAALEAANSQTPRRPEIIDECSRILWGEGELDKAKIEETQKIMSVLDSRDGPQALKNRCEQVEFISAFTHYTLHNAALKLQNSDFDMNTAMREAYNPTVFTLEGYGEKYDGRYALMTDSQQKIINIFSDKLTDPDNSKLIYLKFTNREERTPWTFWTQTYIRQNEGYLHMMQTINEQLAVIASNSEVKFDYGRLISDFIGFLIESPIIQYSSLEDSVGWFVKIDPSEASEGLIQLNPEPVLSIGRFNDPSIEIANSEHVHAVFDGQKGKYSSLTHNLKVQLNGLPPRLPTEMAITFPTRRWTMWPNDLWKLWEDLTNRNIGQLCGCYKDQNLISGVPHLSPDRTEWIHHSSPHFFLPPAGTQEGEKKLTYNDNIELAEFVRGMGRPILLDLE